MKNNLPVKYVQRKFLKYKTNRRNREIFDIDQIDNYEKEQRVKRRTPFRLSTHSDVNQKFYESFMNSTTIYSNKLQQSIQRHREKVGNTTFYSSKNHTKCIYFLQDEPIQKNPVSSLREFQVKGAVEMDKMITRQKRQSLNYRHNLNEQRFNNFYLTCPDQKARSFDKYISRQHLQKLKTQQTIQSNPDIPIIYEKVAYPTNTFSVNWQYKKQKWDRGPIYQRVNKHHSFNLYQIDQQKLEKGRRMSQSNWKSKTLTNWNSISQKQNPCQYERIFHPPNMNFRVKKPKIKTEGKSIKVKARPKRPQFDRQQLCCFKYFQLNPELKTRPRKIYTQE